MKRNAKSPDNEEKSTMASSQLISGPWWNKRENEIQIARKTLSLMPFLIIA
jgi:hypothetical protein